MTKDSFIPFQKVKISEGSESFESWETPPIKLVLKVYLFNVTNKDEYMSGKDSKLKFQQVGPYAYRFVKSLRSSACYSCVRWV